MPPLRIFLAQACRRLAPSSRVPPFTACRYLSSGPAAPITPVSYPVKSKDPSEQETEEDNATTSSRLPPRRPLGNSVERAPAERTWTREEARYLRDAPEISPVSYPTRVAPLPEFKPSAETEEEQVEGEANNGQEARTLREGRKIESFTGILGKLDVQEEVEKVPFPKIIRVEKKPARKVLELQKAIKEVKANARKKFVETVEMHVRLAIDPKRSDQTVRGAVTLPHGTGKSARVAVFAEGAEADEARAAGADIVGGIELVDEIKKGGGKLSFDKCLTTQAFMPRLQPIAKILGPRGLMPNAKLGSLTSDIPRAVKEAKRGRVNFKMDKCSIVHVGLGKVTFSDEALRENIGAFVNALLLAKPAGLKKTSKYAGYVDSIYLCSTMGPGFAISIQSMSEAADQFNKLHPMTSS